MIITDNAQKHKILDKISSKKNSSYYRILPTGELQINGYFKSHVFLAYVNGNWYVSYGARKSASITIPETGVDLFVHSNNSVWIRKNNGDVDFASSDIPLDEGTCFALFAFSGTAFDVIIADGSKHSTVVSTYIKKIPENAAFLAFAFTFFIRQFDNDAADIIMDFWFNKSYYKNGGENNRPQIQFAKKNEISETEKHPSDADEESSNKWQ